MMPLVFARRSEPAARGGGSSGAAVGRGRRGAGGGVSGRELDGGERTQQLRELSSSSSSTAIAGAMDGTVSR
jgi:hypothetical protein